MRVKKVFGNFESVRARAKMLLFFFSRLETNLLFMELLTCIIGWSLDGMYQPWPKMPV